MSLIINSRLRPKPEQPDPVKLADNKSYALKGTIVLGAGFELTPEERDRLVQQNPHNAERIFPYLGGAEVNTSPTHDFHRYVINFGDMSLEEAEQWPELLAIVREKVKPERDKNKRQTRQKYWWQFDRQRKSLTETIAPLDRCLVTARVTKHLCFSFQPTTRVLSSGVYVFPLPAYASFALLQSRIHEPWARLLGGTLKTDLSYTTSRCFDTFAFPAGLPTAALPELETIGEELYCHRAKLMVEHNIGLTKIYNALHKGQFPELARLHEDMDRAVLKEYGWDDIEVPAYGHVTDTFEDEVIDRLMALNKERSNMC